MSSAHIAITPIKHYLNEKGHYIYSGPIEYITGIGLLALPQAASHGVPHKPVDFKRNVWLRLERDIVAEISPNEASLPPDIDPSRCWDVQGRLVTPGFVDCHTHPIFLRTREGEFVRRCRGESYQQIAAAGGGILSTVGSVREADEEQLAIKIRSHLTGFLKRGITAVEAKSGYGLSLEAELKSLRALKTAADGHPVEVSPTLLAAHTIPPEYKRHPDRFVDLVCNEIIPSVSEQQLADAVDVFLEEGAFNSAQARRIFQAGREAGLALRIHADQFTPGGGAGLAAEFGALTADHMDCTSVEDYRRLAEADVTVTLLPGAVFFLGLDQYAPAREIIETGCRIALSTDFNPGSSPTQSMPLMMTLGCIRMGLSPAEALWAATVGGAFGIAKGTKLGSLAVGSQADLCVWNFDSVEAIPYHYGGAEPWAVIKRGKLVVPPTDEVDF